MTIVDQNRREQSQRPKPEPRDAQASRDLAREHGNHVDLLADVAEDCLAEEESERDARTRYEDGLQVLQFLIGAERDERVLEINQVLHDEHGTFCKGKAVEFIGLLLAGQSSLQARQAMLTRQPRRADRERARRAAVVRAREVSANLHSLAEAPRVQPALPVGPVPPQRNGAVLPHREPVAPAEPPMFEPAPPETPGEQTGQIISALREEGFEISPAQEAAARKDHKTSLNLGPVPDSAFSASALPMVRSGDTQRMPVVVPDESPFFADAPDGEGGQEPQAAVVAGAVAAKPKRGVRR